MITLQSNLSFHVDCLRCHVCAMPFLLGERCFVEAESRRVFCLSHQPPPPPTTPTTTTNKKASTYRLRLASVSGQINNVEGKANSLA